MGRKPKTKGETKSSNNKVSEMQEEEAEEEVWDVFRVVSKNEECPCRAEGCKEQAVATWATNLSPDDKWNMCEECQLRDFGGWPEGVDPCDSDDEEQPEEASKTEQTQPTPTEEQSSIIVPSSSDGDPSSEKGRAIAGDDQSDSTPMAVDEPPIKGNMDTKAPPGDNSEAPPSDESRGSVKEASTQTIKDSPAEPSVATPAASQDDGDHDEANEIWDLKKILSCQDILKEATIKCSTDECALSACSVWVSNLAPTTKWYTCVGCQDNDFDGWPPFEELPIKHMELNQLQAIASKCSKQKNPAMPTFPSLSDSPSRKQSNASANFVTPPPNALGGKGAQTISGISKGGDAAKITPKLTKPSAGALAMHKKWQEAAEGIGGKDARIVVSKPVAKKLIFDMLYDAFRPMNITEIYKALKAVVPSPVLSACLQDMALDKNDGNNPFADSDDEDDVKEEITSTEPYTGSLLFKAGRNQASNLYYVDHTKIKGMDRDQRETLASDMAIAKAEEDSLKVTLKTKLARATQLLTEPTNEEAAVQLEAKETVITELEGNLEEAQKLKVNEKHKQKTKRRIQNMAAQWRRRKRLCMDFLIQLEETTDGTISARKCLKGDGQIALDSDEAVAKATVQFTKDKKSRNLKGGLKRKKKVNVVRGINKGSDASSNASLADDTFVAVTLDSQQNVHRVYMDSQD